MTLAKVPEQMSLALPAVEKARSILAATRSKDEIGRIRAIAQAVATAERGREIGCDAGEIVVLADTRRAELEANERAARPKGGKREQGNSGVTLPKRQLVSEGRRAPLLALSDSDQRAYFAKCRKARQPPTTMGASALGKADPKDRKRALAMLGDRADVRKVLSILKRTERTEALAKSAAAFPGGKYAVIYADPPWPYEHVKTESRAIENHYPTMTLGEIEKLDVPSLATDDALLFLWSPSPKLEEALAVMRAWGFTYRTGMIWDKEVVGMGYWVRVQHEHLLIGTRGNPPTPPPEARVPSVVYSRREGHSEKPDVFYGIIEAMYPTLPRVELFARGTPRKGWKAWGNEVARG